MLKKAFHSLAIIAGVTGPVQAESSGNKDVEYQTLDSRDKLCGVIDTSFLNSSNGDKAGLIESMKQLQIYVDNCLTHIQSLGNYGTEDSHLYARVTEILSNVENGLMGAPDSIEDERIELTIEQLTELYQELKLVTDFVNNTEKVEQDIRTLHEFSESPPSWLSSDEIKKDFQIFLDTFWKAVAEREDFSIDHITTLKIAQDQQRQIEEAGEKLMWERLTILVVLLGALSLWWMLMQSNFQKRRDERALEEFKKTKKKALEEYKIISDRAKAEIQKVHDHYALTRGYFSRSRRDLVKSGYTGETKERVDEFEGLHKFYHIIIGELGRMIERGESVIKNQKTQFGWRAGEEMHLLEDAEYTIDISECCITGRLRDVIMKSGLGGGDEVIHEITGTFREFAGLLKGGVYDAFFEESTVLQRSIRTQEDVRSETEKSIEEISKIIYGIQSLFTPYEDSLSEAQVEGINDSFVVMFQNIEEVSRILKSSISKLDTSDPITTNRRLLEYTDFAKVFVKKVSDINTNFYVYVQSHVAQTDSRTLRNDAISIILGISSGLQEMTTLFRKQAEDNDLEIAGIEAQGASVLSEFDQVGEGNIYEGRIQELVIQAGKLQEEWQEREAFSDTGIDASYREQIELLFGVFDENKEQATQQNGSKKRGAGLNVHIALMASELSRIPAIARRLHSHYLGLTEILAEGEALKSDLRKQSFVFEDQEIRERYSKTLDTLFIGFEDIITSAQEEINKGGPIDVEGYVLSMYKSLDYIKSEIGVINERHTQVQEMKAQGIDLKKRLIFEGEEALDEGLQKVYALGLDMLFGEFHERYQETLTDERIFEDIDELIHDMERELMLIQPKADRLRGSCERFPGSKRNIVETFEASQGKMLTLREKEETIQLLTLEANDFTVRVAEIEGSLDSASRQFESGDVFIAQESLMATRALVNTFEADIREIEMSSGAIIGLLGENSRRICDLKRRVGAIATTRDEKYLSPKSHEIIDFTIGISENFASEEGIDEIIPERLKLKINTFQKQVEYMETCIVGDESFHEILEEYTKSAEGILRQIEKSREELSHETLWSKIKRKGYQLKHRVWDENKGYTSKSPGESIEAKTLRIKQKLSSLKHSGRKKKADYAGLVNDARIKVIRECLDLYNGIYKTSEDKLFRNRFDKLGADICIILTWLEAQGSYIHDIGFKDILKASQRYLSDLDHDSAGKYLEKAEKKIENILSDPRLKEFSDRKTREGLSEGTTSSDGNEDQVKSMKDVKEVVLKVQGKTVAPEGVSSPRQEVWPENMRGEGGPEGESAGRVVKPRPKPLHNEGAPIGTE